MTQMHTPEQIAEIVAHRDELRQVAHKAALLLGAVYDHVDRIEAAGGTTCISGISACHAMLKSLNANRARANALVIDPLNAAIARAGAA